MTFFKRYEYVLAVSRYGGISQAAEALGIAQPTLSKFLKKLEEEVGAELFDRTTVPITLTPAGELFLESGKRMLDVERQFQKQLRETLENKNSVVRIGISPSRSPYMIPSIIEAYRKKHPDGRVVIEERTTSELNSRLFEGDLDLIITLAGEDTQNFVSVPLFEEELLLAVPKDPEYSSYTAEEALRSVSLINVGKGQAMWQTINSIVDAVGAGRPEIECQSIESALALVKHGLGATIVPSYIREFGSGAQNANVSFMSLAYDGLDNWEASVKRKVCLFYRKEQFLTQSERDFIDCVKSVLIKNN